MSLTAKFAPLWYEYQDVHPHIFQEVMSINTYLANIPGSILSRAGVQIGEFAVKCNFGTNICNRTGDFTRFFDPVYFNCYTYTSPHAEKSALSEGIKNGWSSIFFTSGGILDRNDDIRVLPGLQDIGNLMYASEGLRVVIHPPGTMIFPHMEGFDVPPGYSSSFGISPRRVKRLGLPHGNCTIHNPLGNTAARYRLMACQQMCLQRYIANSCNCKDKALPDLPELKMKNCRTLDDLPDSCMVSTSGCMKYLLRLYNNTECIRASKVRFDEYPTIMDDCSCFPACDEISYDVSYSLSKWPASGYAGDIVYLDIFYIDGFLSRFKDTPKYNMLSNYFKNHSNDREKSLQNFAHLNVYIADRNVNVMEEKEDYGRSALLSDIGGQLGLWIGISIITLAEVLECACD